MDARDAPEGTGWPCGDGVVSSSHGSLARGASSGAGEHPPASGANRALSTEAWPGGGGPCDEEAVVCNSHGSLSADGRDTWPGAKEGSDNDNSLASKAQRPLASSGNASSRDAHAPAHRCNPLKEPLDTALDVNLPYRTLTRTAQLQEYRIETAAGELPNAAPSKYRIVTFVRGDPDNPLNWSTAFKWYCTMVVALTCFVVAFASAVVTADVAGVAREFAVAEEVALLSVTLFVVGFGVGPMIFAPLSEVYGRRVIYGSTLLLAVVFIVPCAVAKNVATLLVCRALDGIAFSAPMTLVGGTLADLWRSEERGVPMAAFSAAPFIGPAIGPLIGGFLSDAAGWRWLYWIQLIFASIVWILITFTVPETYTPTILARRARRLRASTGDPAHVTEQELDMRPLSERLAIFLVRPFQLLFGELIVFLISLYMSVLYGLLYMFFVAYPIVYQTGKGYSAGKTGLMFIPVAVGVVCSALCSPLVNRHYVKLVRRHRGYPPAEVRLIPMMMACWCIPVGLFIFAWTSYPHLSWAGPAMGGFPVGFGFIFLYNSANNYLVDSYQHQAASALAAKTFIRSFWGAAVVLFTAQMYQRLGYQWASTLLAFLSLACCAIPFLFWKFGARIRARSRFAYGGDEDLDSVSDSAEAAKEKGRADGGVIVRDDMDKDDDLRRARSYVSNP